MRRALGLIAPLLLAGSAADEQTGSPCGTSVEVALSEVVPAVATVRWDACADDGEGWVEFESGGRSMTAPGRLVEGGLLVHDNGSPDTASSRAAEYALDANGGTAELVWEYFPDPAYSNYALGDVSRLPSGHTLVTWGMAGQVDEVDADGALVWRLNVELGAGIGYTTWLEQLQ